MNPFQKIFYRRVQLAFRAALPVLPYRTPRIADRVEDIPAILEMKGA